MTVADNALDIDICCFMFPKTDSGDLVDCTRQRIGDWLKSDNLVLWGEA